MRIQRPLAVVLAAAIFLPAMAHAVPRRGGGGVTTTSPSRSGFTAPYARVIVGDTLEIWRNGGRVGIGLIGMDAAEGNTRCGVKATRRLDRLVAGGITFERQPGRQYDGRLRRMYYGLTPDGTSIALRMVRLGLAYAVAEGRERRVLAAAERSARAEGRGCLWRRSGHTALAESLEIPRGVATIPDLGPELRAAAPEALVPTGFTEQVVASGLNLPTAFTELPDGRILVAEKPGLVRVIKNGQVLPTPFIDIRAQVNDYWDRGLVGIAADPDFASNGYVYLYFTYENNATNYEGPKTARLIRVTASGDTAPLASATVILGTTVGTSCNNFAPGTDCIPTDGPGHSTGDIEFASDGTMFVSVGDGAHWNAVVQDALRAQNLDLLAGKLLHITKTGKGVPSNPFWNGNADANRSKVYAYGLRNSYRGGLRPGTNVPYFGDVGWGTREEINVVTPGANLGWPCWEGTFKPAYQSQQTCVNLYAQGTSAVRFPLIEYPHSGTSAAATGGTFYSGTSFPSEYRGAYFYGDYARGWIKYIRVNASDGLVSGPTDLTTTAGAPVDIQEGSDGALYYISIYPGELRRICYGSCSSSPPPPPSSGYPAEVLADNPLGYWRLGESSGTTAADASGNNRPGTYVGGPTLGSPGLQSSDADTSITVNGLTQRVEVPHAATWNLTGDLTIEALVNVTGGDNYRTIVAKHDANGDVPVYEFRIQAINNRLQFVQKTTAGTFLSITGNTTLAVGTTYHVAVTKSGSTVTLYVNGAVDKTQTFSGTIATNTKPVTFGRRDGSKALAGRIDEVAIYGTALSASRIAAHRAAV